MLFSQRMKLVDVSDVIQKDYMSTDLRTSLWNYFYGIQENDYDYEFGKQLRNYLCVNLYKVCVDDFDRINPYDIIKSRIMQDEWYSVYDMLEISYKFTKSNTRWDAVLGEDFAEICNLIFESENSAYRFINGEITPITDENEIKSIEEAINDAPHKGVKEHLTTALSLLSDREHPDYRNSIKESISAVEAICRQITKESTLDKALPKLKIKGIQIPSILEDGMKKMYYFTNDKNGIRHALMDEGVETNFEEAKYMLVVCSAFINYLMAKQVRNS